MEVIRVEDCGKALEFKYEVIPSLCGEWVELVDGRMCPMLWLRKYYKNNDGEWKECQHCGTKYVTLEALLANYVLIDSTVYSRIIDSDSMIKEYRSEKLDNMLKLYTDIQGDPNIGVANENFDPQGEK